MIWWAIFRTPHNSGCCTLTLQTTNPLALPWRCNGDKKEIALIYGKKGYMFRLSIYVHAISFAIFHISSWRNTCMEKQVTWHQLGQNFNNCIQHSSLASSSILSSLTHNSCFIISCLQPEISYIIYFDNWILDYHIALTLFLVPYL